VGIGAQARLADHISIASTATRADGPESRADGAKTILKIGFIGLVQVLNILTVSELEHLGLNYKKNKKIISRKHRVAKDRIPARAIRPISTGSSGPRTFPCWVTSSIKKLTMG
jgi:hypothetical protein